MGLNVERPADLLSMFRLRSKPAFPFVAQSEAETQTEDTANDSDSADLTMQFGISAEESVHSHDTIHPVPPANKSVNTFIAQM